MLGGTVSGLNSVGEGFIFGYSPPLLDKIETIEDTSFSSVDGVNKLEFTKYITLNEKVDIEIDTEQLSSSEYHNDQLLIIDILRVLFNHHVT